MELAYVLVLETSFCGFKSHHPYQEVEMKRLSILIGISCISITVFAVMRTILISVRGTATFGGEALILIIPLLVWLVFKNIDLTKEEMKDVELSKEAENASRIKVKDFGGAVQITDIHVIDK